MFLGWNPYSWKPKCLQIGVQVQYNSNQNTSRAFLNRHRQADPKMYIEKQNTRIAKAILKKISFGGITLPNASFKPQRIILRS